jgi:ribonucleoside-diphosphate reductase alpha chain
MASMALQYGVPLEALVRKFSHMRFEPQGFTNNPKIPMAKSLIDYIFRWMGLKFLNDPELAGAAAMYYEENGNGHMEAVKTPELPAPEAAEKIGRQALPAMKTRSVLIEEEHRVADTQSDAPTCHVCGTLMRRSGSCYLCANCGANTGCS